MATTKAPLADGQTVSAAAGPVVVSVQCIRPGFAYRLSVARTGFGGFANREVEELCRSYADEGQARRAARMATVLLRAGMTVQELVNAVALFTAQAA
jgi:hypothetical protein